MTLLDRVATSCLLTAAVSWCALAFYYRHQLRKLIRRNAEAAEHALIGMVHIDGIALPLPTDSRWTFYTVKGSDGLTSVETLQLVNVRVTRSGVYIGPPTEKLNIITGSTESATRSLTQYAREVWTAYRSRMARASTEAS